MKPPASQVFERFPIKLLAHYWPVSSVARYIEARWCRTLLETLIAELGTLSQEISLAKYAQATKNLLLRQQRAAAKVKVEAKNALHDKHLVTRSAVASLRVRCDVISAEMRQLVAQDRRWQELASQLHSQRTSLWQEVTKWDPKWQKLMAATLSEVDAAIRYAPRATKPEGELMRAVQRLHRVRTDLDWVKGIGARHVAAAKISIQVEAIQATSDSYFQRELSSFRETLTAGRSCFASGDYAAASRHLNAAQDTARKIFAAQRAEKHKRRSDADQWLAILANGKGAGSLSQDISVVLEGGSRPTFLVEWENLHERIDEHVTALACEMGDRDQKVIAKGLKVRQIMQWRQKLDTDELTRFAMAVAKRL